MKIHVLQHVPFEQPAQIAVWGETRSHAVIITRLYNNDPLPKIADGDALVIMGGPMSVHDTDEYPWLRDEISCVRDAVDRGVKTLGVCLGAQIIATALGGRVYRNAEKEIGWFAVERKIDSIYSGSLLPERLIVFHWHGETFDLPPHAKLLFSSEGCVNQGFVCGSAIAFQFHIEMDASSIARMIENCGDELVGGKYIQNRDEIIRGEKLYGESNTLLLFELLDSGMEQ